MYILFTCTATWQKTTNMHILETLFPNVIVANVVKN